MKYLLIAGLFFSLNALADLPPPSGGGDGLGDPETITVCSYKDNGEVVMLREYSDGRSCTPILFIEHTIMHYDPETGLTTIKKHDPTCELVLDIEIKQRGNG